MLKTSSCGLNASSVPYHQLLRQAHSRKNRCFFNDLLHLRYIRTTMEHRHLGATVVTEFCCFDLINLRALLVEHDPIVFERTLGRDKIIEHVLPHLRRWSVEGMAPAATTRSHDTQQVALTQAVIVA